MKLYDLIKSYHWKIVEIKLINLYPDQKDIIQYYQKVYSELQMYIPVFSDTKIVLTEFKTDIELEEEKTNTKNFIDVSGQDGTIDENGNKIFYAIEFEEWKKWLGMDIDQNTLTKFSEIEIIAHCLYEMTFAGFNEKEIQGFFKMSEKRLDEYKNSNN